MLVRGLFNTNKNDNFAAQLIIMNHYETVFILNPVLSDDQVKEAVQKYADFITSNGGALVHQEDWGLKKFAYPIQNKKSGFYHLFDFQISPDAINAFELEFRRDERVMRYLTVKLDKHAEAWAEKRRERQTVKS